MPWFSKRYHDKAFHYLAKIETLLFTLITKCTEIFLEAKHCVVCIGNVGFKIFIMEVILSPSLTSKLLSAKFVCLKAAALLEETSVKCKNLPVRVHLWSPWKRSSWSSHSLRISAGSSSNFKLYWTFHDLVKFSYFDE